MKKLALVWVGVWIITSVLPGAALAQQDECYQKGGIWDPDTGRCMISEGVRIDINYPVLMLRYPLAEQVIDEYLTGLRTNFLSAYNDPAKLPSVVNLWSLNVDFEVFWFSETIAGIKFRIDDYTGGAHGNTYFQTFTFDFRQERVLALEDLFRTGIDPYPTLYPLVRENLVAQLGADAEAAWIDQGTGLDPLNYQHFVITPDGLTFFFPPYQVIAYAWGPLTVTIPLAQIAGILAPPFTG